MSDDDGSTTWQPGDDPLEDLPEPAGSAVAQWRSEGLGDTKIRSLILTAASWDGADGQAVRLDGRPIPSPGPWQRALRELRRRDAANLDHETAAARRLSDALDAALTKPDPPAGPLETALPGPITAKLREATNEQIDAMLRRLWEQRANQRLGLSRKAVREKWSKALAEVGLTSTQRQVETRYGHKANQALRGPPGHH